MATLVNFARPDIPSAPQPFQHSPFSLYGIYKAADKRRKGYFATRLVQSTAQSH